jgi:exopolysaccharide biosynthesis polyprenyl glycosylphosphotransferase
MEASNLTSSPDRALPREIQPTMDAIAHDSSSARKPPPQLKTANSDAAISRAGTRSTVLRRLLLGADLAGAVIGGLVTSLAFGIPVESALIFTAAIVVGAVMLGFVFGLYTDGGLGGWASGLSDAPRMLVAALLLSWPLLGVANLLSLGDAPLVALVATSASVGFDSVTRALARGWAHRLAPLRQRTVIVGSGIVADRLADRLARHPEFGLETIGLVDDEIHTLDGTQQLNKLGSLDELHTVIEEHAVNRVIVAFSRASHDQLLNCVRTCRDHRVAVDVVPRLFELLDGARSLSQIGGLPLLSIGAPPLTRMSRGAKRALDIVLAAIALIVLSPLLMVIALAVKATSRGPALFRQHRAGRGAADFQLLKFRSMYDEADRHKEQYAARNDADDGVMFKIKRDPRITPVGGFLRRFSLDELPQLYNVLRGDMSLVGPRPLIPSEATHAAQTWHARRLDLRPGMTGLWQISGRSDVPFQEMVRFDYQYVAGWSLARDVEILLATLPVVLSGRGAY